MLILTTEYFVTAVKYSILQNYNSIAQIKEELAVKSLSDFAV